MRYERLLEKTDVLFEKWSCFYSNDKQDDLDDKSLKSSLSFIKKLYLAQDFTSQMKQHLFTLMKVIIPIRRIA